MAKYPLEALLSARLFREEAAEREARRAGAALEEARAAAAAALAELERYRKWRPGEEERLFGLLRGRHLPLGDLDKHRGDVQALRDAELQREEERRAADQAVAAAEAAAEKARRRQFEATRDRRKIDEHRSRWRLEEGRRLEAAEESELEDLSARPGSGAEAEAEAE